MPPRALAVETDPLLSLLDRHFEGPALDHLLALDAGRVSPDLWERALAGPLREFLSRPGKEIRSRLVAVGYRLAGGSVGDPTVPGAIVELLHAGSLIVDDIEDGSLQRRGGPTLHRRHGIPLALNAGNYLYFWPLLLVEDLPVGELLKLAIYRRISSTLLRCHHGQALDVAVRVTEVAQRDVAGVVESAARLKTGSLTGLALWLGAAAGGASATVERAVDEFGNELGVCLQMLDDLGGITSAPRRDKGHEDLREGKLTWPWAWIARTSDERRYEGLRALGEAVGRGHLPPETLAREMRRHIGDRAKPPIRRRLRAGLGALRAACGPSPALAALAQDVERLERSYD